MPRCHHQAGRWNVDWQWRKTTRGGLSFCAVVQVALVRVLGPHVLRSFAEVHAVGTTMGKWTAAGSAAGDCRRWPDLTSRFWTTCDAIGRVRIRFRFRRSRFESALRVQQRLCATAPLRNSFIDTKCTWPCSNDSGKSYQRTIRCNRRRIRCLNNAMSRCMDYTS
jgi:hypothetical protein